MTKQEAEDWKNDNLHYINKHAKSKTDGKSFTIVALTVNMIEEIGYDVYCFLKESETKGVPKQTVAEPFGLVLKYYEIE